VAFIADGLKRNFPFIKCRINVIAVISIRCTRVRRARWENRVIGSARVIAIWNYYDLQLVDDRLPSLSSRRSLLLAVIPQNVVHVCRIYQTEYMQKYLL